MNKAKKELIKRIERDIKNIEQAQGIFEEALYLSRNGSKENGMGAAIGIHVYRKGKDETGKELPYQSVIGAAGLLPSGQREVMEYIVPKIREGLDNLQADLEKVKDALEAQGTVKVTPGCECGNECDIGYIAQKFVDLLENAMGKMDLKE